MLLQMHTDPSHAHAHMYCICTAVVIAKFYQQVEEYPSKTVANAKQGFLSVNCVCMCLCPFGVFLTHSY